MMNSYSVNIVAILSLLRCSFSLLSYHLKMLFPKLSKKKLYYL